MIKVAFGIVLSVFFISSCSEPEYFCAKSGVEYIQKGTGISPHLSKIGIPVKCEG